MHIYERNYTTTDIKNKDLETGKDNWEYFHVFTKLQIMSLILLDL